MKQITIKTLTTTLEIEVSDSTFAQQWFSYAQALTRDNFYLTRAWPMTPDVDLRNAGKAYIDLVRAVDYVSTNIPDFDWTETKHALSQVLLDKNQQHCNTIHRAFTFMTLQGHLKKFYTPELDKQVHVINSAVHELESLYTYQKLDTRQRFNGRVQQVLFTDAGNMEGKDFSVWNTAIPDWCFDHRTQDTNYNVWLNEDILGKDLVRCFLDNDDPNNPDITGNLFLTPSLYIDVDSVYSKVLQSPEFNEWHQRLCPNKTLNRYPIGNVNRTTIDHLNDCEPVTEYRID